MIDIEAIRRRLAERNNLPRRAGAGAIAAHWSHQRLAAPKLRRRSACSISSYMYDQTMTALLEKK